MEDVHHRQPDGVMVYGKSIVTKKKTGILIIPDIGQTLLHSYYDKLSEYLQDIADVHAVELRGHKLSQGKWSLHSYRVDVTFWISHFRQMYKNFYVIATGFSASTMLEYDDQAHTFRLNRPALPDGMVLINPVFDGHDVLPDHGTHHKIARKMFGPKTVAGKLKKLNVRFDDPALFWKEMEGYKLSPVRIQTPSIIFVAGDELSDPLLRIFGNVNIRRMKWLHHGTNAEVAKHFADVKKAVKEVMSGEKPHRFTTTK